MQKLRNDLIINEEYLKLLQLMGRLSNLFSDSNIPFIHYRITENLFCKCFKADNLSRSDTAYDARLDKLGIGIKTFQLKSGDRSLEKIAEFNKLSSELRSLKGMKLAQRVSKLRNERIELANSLYGISESLYHVIGRKEGSLSIFNTPYRMIDLQKITDVKSKSDRSITYNDGQDDYTYNQSKSVLLKQFSVPQDHKDIPIEIISDPYELLESLIDRDSLTLKKPMAGLDYVILPLYSVRHGSVPQKSGLNQWNAEGRKRNYNEIYIPVPRMIHSKFSGFFPNRDESFTLTLPNNKIINAKICQDGEKSLMSNPNSALGEWLLRDIMKMKDGELVTLQKLNELGFDSVIITKITTLTYTINVCNTDKYSDFIVR